MVSRWRPLPDTLDPAGQLLAQELRVLKERTGLSLDGLARKTPYSKSAWHRYLNGEKLPPRAAVEALGRVAGADQVRLLGRYEAAHRARTAPAPAPVPAGNAPATTGFGPPPAATGPARRKLRGAAVLTALTAVLATVGAAASIASIPAHAVRAEWTAPDTCHGHRCQGRYPGRFGCHRDARTQSTITDATYTVRLLFSPACGTVWSEVRPRSGGAEKVSIWVGRDARLTSHPGSRAGRAVSPMLATEDLHSAVACARVADRVACTGALELKTPARPGPDHDLPDPTFLLHAVR
ncbi:MULTISPECIES: helix-turn-helix domain-containing protein [Streptomyces]|uniref:Helix-turn-helix domain-containing protein n=1 Tax=Streptomyces siderophoricus TaxID=2802281 RepID=A0ABS1N4K1_9ACTN|nr:XRE family transcriptional regulator [Streptomyces sp. 9-7]MBL1094844.1 helix-turn-helix domain-containing protein [Streptomyces sp. 9-7]